MNEIKIFDNVEFGQIRTVAINEKNYFVASDVAKALGYARPADAISAHCRYTAKHSIPHPQSKDKTIEVNVIPEGDIYRLVTHSQLPGAERFESWVFDEVIPSIRKHGIYATDNVIDNILNNPDFGIAILNKLKEERAARIKAEQKNAILTHVNKTYTMTEIAKELNLKSAIELNKILADKKIQYKVNGTWVFYSDYSNLGYEDIKEFVINPTKKLLAA